MFHDAAGVFFLQDHLASFFEEYGAENPLLKAVAADLAEPVYLAGCKALGLINKLLTGPLWHVLESKMSILDVHTSMRDQFKVWSEDASSFLEGRTALFDDTTIKHGEILDMTSSWKTPTMLLSRSFFKSSSNPFISSVNVFWWITFLGEFMTNQVRRKDARHSQYQKPTLSVSETSHSWIGF